jgi:hypothetical protein
VKPGPISWWKWAGLFLLLASVFGLRVLFGIWTKPVQPMEDEVQTYLLGLRYATTGEWPYYGNDVIKPGTLDLQTQDPGALQGLWIGLPLRLWPDPLAPFLAANVLSLASFLLLAWYASRRLPGLPAWFIYPYVLLATWCIHYTTNIMELSYSIPVACVFFVALWETLPSFRLGLFKPWVLNLTMGACLSWWVQLHRTWVMLFPLLALSFYLQWKETRRLSAPAFFLLGALPFSLALLLPTLLHSHYSPGDQAATFFYGFNARNFLAFFKILAQFFALACYEMPRFIGIGTRLRYEYLRDNGLLFTGGYLWVFGILQVLVLGGFLFVKKGMSGGWGTVKAMTWGIFFWFYGALLFTAKNPEVNNVVEMLPLVMLYALYVWEMLWTYRLSRVLLLILLLSAIAFRTAYPFVERPGQKSFYLLYRDRVVQALAQRDWRVLAERRPGFLY